jgi:16S rRNA (cytosine1402-N4)-methyltransferase
MAEVFSHEPVLLDEALQALAIRAEGIYIDATFGRGGHSAAIVARLNANGRVLALDQDPAAVAHGREMFADEPRIEFEHCNFSQMARVVAERKLQQRIDGVLMDLGVSSPQLDDAARGFSFLRSGPLDMRMNTEVGESAMQWLQHVEARDLVYVLKRFGEERFAKRIAHAIVTARVHTPIIDTVQLAELVAAAVPVKEKHKHAATRSFQAIRIYINRELEALAQGLADAADSLALKGRLAVISFHSLEDRMVKRFMRDRATPEQLPPGLPVMHKDVLPPFRLVSRSITASDAELAHNPRARSARLRVLERVQ